MSNLYLLISLFIASLIGNFILMKYGDKISISKNDQIQNIHQGRVSRLGGLILIILFFIYLHYSQIISLHFILFSSPILIPALLEDFGKNIKPRMRLFFILLASLFLVINLKTLPQFDMNYLNFILNNSYFQIIFYTLALATVINGQNIIDGTNGLSAITGIIIFICIGFLGIETSNLQIVQLASFIIILLFSFLIFNFPFGKIFLGDAGSYFIGLLGGYIVIKIFAQNTQLPTWSAIIILFYPTLEVVFSFFRKIFNNQSPFLPDKKHLHLKIYFLLTKGNAQPHRLYNSLVAPFLSIIWLSPLALLPLSLKLPHFSLLLLSGLVLVYFFFYFSIPDPE